MLSCRSIQTISSRMGRCVLVLANSKLFIILDHDVEATRLLQRVESTCHFPVHSRIAIARIPYFLGRTCTKEKNWEVWDYTTPPGAIWNCALGLEGPSRTNNHECRLLASRYLEASERVRSVVIEHVATSPLIKARVAQIATAPTASARRLMAGDSWWRCRRHRRMWDVQDSILDRWIDESLHPHS